ncbi:hypothetical protein [Pararhizobium antarcticum]|uniref:Uncharacterized protein n=1 Tax=Pararhizobium antarcticum TaxID=1798805 RepID=A0A657LUZ6_9HYPH|nr:hypothetical protein [Pararhizobium antarcticum]OJF95281.1 hypothetical protein AX760_19625 [Pararhizobium antarcticum]OJF96355.1 hypothetical protein AX761_15910 [Rhizobium sp. 58]
MPFAITIALSIHTIVNTLQAAPALAAAKLIEDGAPVSSAALAALPESFFVTNGCYTPAKRAAVTLTLTLADQQNIAADYDAWAAAVSRAEAAVISALSCSPADGNLWLRLAMTRLAAGENPTEQVALLSMSQQMEPSSGRIITARLSHWKRLSNATLLEGESIVGADISLALRYLDPKTVQSPATPRTDEWKRIVLSRIALLPEDKQRALLPSVSNGL